MVCNAFLGHKIIPREAADARNPVLNVMPPENGPRIKDLSGKFIVESLYRMLSSKQNMMLCASAMLWICLIEMDLFKQQYFAIQSGSIPSRLSC